MRAREFITEQRAELDPAQAGPLQHTYILPGVRNNDAYTTMRLSVAMARARAEVGGYDKDMPPWTSQSAFGQNALVAGFNSGIEEVIDRALDMMEIPGGKQLIGSKHSEEPEATVSQSPIRGFRGFK